MDYDQKRLTTYGFGIPNLWAFGDTVKYFPDEFLKDLGLLGCSAEQIYRFFMIRGFDIGGIGVRNYAVKTGDGGILIVLS